MTKLSYDELSPYVECIREFIKTLQTNPEQNPVITQTSSMCVIDTNTNHLNKFKVFALNRDININHSKMLENECFAMHLEQKFIILTVALDITDIIQIYNDDRENWLKNCSELKFKILDGQHRFTALQNRWKSIKDPARILVLCHLVQGDDEIQRLVEDLNKTLPLTEKDFEGIEKKKEFRILLAEIFTGVNLNKRCIKHVFDSPIIREPEFVQCLHSHSDDEIKEAIYKISKEYKTKYDSLSKLSPAINDAIQISKIYQLIEGENPIWLREIITVLAEQPTKKRQRVN